MFAKHSMYGPSSGEKKNELRKQIKWLKRSPKREQHQQQQQEKREREKREKVEKRGEERKCKRKRNPVQT